MISWIRPKIDRLLLADRNYAFLFQPDKSGEIVSLDCETTGFNPMADDVISIAAVKIRGTRILASQAFRALIRPGAPMEASAIKVHQLREQDVARGRTMREVLPDFLRFVGSRPLVGYWIAFDVRMLNKYLFSLLNVHLPNRRIEVSKLYYDRKFGSAPPGTRIDLRYATILADLGLPSRAQHDAFEDALGAAESYLVLEDMRERGVRLPRQWPAAYGGMPLAQRAAARTDQQVWISSGARGPDQIEASRRFWGVPRFDLLQVHNLLSWEEHLRTLLAMKAAGRLRYVGITTSEGRRHSEVERIMRACG